MGDYSKLDRPIVAVDYDPRWPALFESEKERLAVLLGARAVDIQHIGSTAIPGLAAKPIIDIAVGFQELQTAESCIPLLEDAGYAYEPDLEAALPGRRFLWRVNSAGQRYHLHVASIHSPLWINPLAFRDYLRRHPKAVSEYRQLKAALAEACGSDIGAYVDGKAGFVQKILILANAKAASR